MKTKALRASLTNFIVLISVALQFYIQFNKYNQLAKPVRENVFGVTVILFIVNLLAFLFFLRAFIKFIHIYKNPDVNLNEREKRFLDLSSISIIESLKMFLLIYFIFVLLVCYRFYLLFQ